MTFGHILMIKYSNKGDSFIEKKNLLYMAKHYGITKSQDQDYVYALKIIIIIISRGIL